MLAFITLRDRATVRLPLSVAEVARRFAEKIPPRRWLHLTYGRGYEGDISARSFSLCAVQSCKRDMRSMIHVRGELCEVQTGGGAGAVETRIDVRLRHPWFVIGLNLILLGLTLLMLIVAPVVMLQERNPDYRALYLGPSFMLAFWLIVNSGAWLILRRVRREVADLLAGIAGSA